MQNEIELKIMLAEPLIPGIKMWLDSQAEQPAQSVLLGNTYFDTPDRFFAREQMGFRVRRENARYEMTLKMKGEITGGLHIRPEYNLDLPDETPDFKRLVSHFNLQIDQAEQTSDQLQAIFSTDFKRTVWLLRFQQSEIEVALDQGMIKNPYGEEPICELEFELKQGVVADLFDLLDLMPKQDGMWLSSLSKAQRGYLVGQADKIAKETAKLTACQWQDLSPIQQYQLTQQIADFLRLSPEHRQLHERFQQLDKPMDNPARYLTSTAFFNRSLSQLKACH